MFNGYGPLNLIFADKKLSDAQLRHQLHQPITTLTMLCHLLLCLTPLNTCTKSSLEGGKHFS